MEVIKTYHQIKKPSAGFAILIKLAQSVEIALAMFVVYAQLQCAKNPLIWNGTTVSFWELLSKKIAVWVI